MRGRVLAILALMGVAAGVGSVQAQTEKYFVVNALPATVLISTSGNKFAATGGDGRVSLSEVYTMPNIAAGIVVGKAGTQPCPRDALTAELKGRG